MCLVTTGLYLLFILFTALGVPGFVAHERGGSSNLGFVEVVTLTLDALGCFPALLILLFLV